MAGAARLFDQLTAARAHSDAIAAAKKYEEACSAFPGLGTAKIHESTNADGEITRTLVAAKHIPANTAITAFPPDVVVYNAPPRDDTFALDTRDGDEMLARETLQHLVDHFKLPVVGFPPLIAIASDPSARTVKPDAAAILARDVIDENPYLPLIRPGPGGPGWSEEDLPKFAAAVAKHISVIALKSNANVRCAAGKPAMLFAVRDIVPGEAIISPRLPLYWLGDDEVLAEAIVRAMDPKTDKERSDLRAQIGLSPK